MTNSRFKYRVWNKLRKEWDNRWLLGADGEPFFITNDSAPESKTANKCYFTEDIEIVQSTGLYDCEGREVWEGDIFSVEAPYYQGAVNFSVQWLQDNLEWVGINELVTFINGDTRREFDNLVGFMRHGRLNHKIIGNRFEHPELLEGEE